MQPRYYPAHWRLTRPFSKDLAQVAGQAALSGGHPAASKVMLEAITKAAVRGGRELQTLIQGEFLSRELMVTETVAQLEIGHGGIYDFSAPLVEALRHSSPGEMRLADLSEPGPFYYLHFGPQDDLLLNGRWPLEGVIVNHIHRNYRFLLVGRSQGQTWLHPQEHEHYMLRMPQDGCEDLPFDEAIEMAVAIDIQDIEAARVKFQSRTDIDLPGAAEAFDKALQTHTVNRPVMVQALRLIGNALAYLGAYPEDARMQWQPGTPEAWVMKAGRAGKEGVNSTSKLRAMGYRKVHLVGRGFEAAVDEAQEAHEAQGAGHAGGGGTKSPHWRDGHWRNQPHGPALSLRKLIWIRPMRILGSRGRS